MATKQPLEPLSMRANMLWNAAGSVVNLGCQWLISILIVRFSMGFEDAGLYSLAMAIFGIFSPIGQYRMYTIQISDVNGETSLGEYFSFRFVTNGIAFVMCMTYAFITASSEAVWIVFAYFLYRAVPLTIDIFHACDQVHHRMDLIGKSLMMQGVLSVVVFSAVFILTHNLVLTLACMAFAMLCIGFVFDFPRTSSFEKVRLGISFAKTKHLLLSCLPIVLAAVAASAASSLPRQVLSSAFGDSSLGIYASAAAPVAIVQMSASYIYNPLMSYFAESYYKGDSPSFRKLMRQCIFGMLMVCVVSIVGVALFGEPLLTLLYGGQMRDFVYLLYPLIILAVLTGFMWFMNDLLISIRVFKGALFGSVIALLSSICAIPLVFCFDMNGVTYTCIVSALVSIVGMALFLVKKIKSHFWEEELQSV